MACSYSRSATNYATCDVELKRENICHSCYNNAQLMLVWLLFNPETRFAVVFIAQPLSLIVGLYVAAVLVVLYSFAFGKGMVMVVVVVVVVEEEEEEEEKVRM
jgi:hypothetical protein